MQGTFWTKAGNIMWLNTLTLIIIIILLTLIIININVIVELFMCSYPINISSLCSFTAYHDVHVSSLHLYSFVSLI